MWLRIPSQKLLSIQRLRIGPVPLDFVTEMKMLPLSKVILPLPFMVGKLDRAINPIGNEFEPRCCTQSEG